MNELPSRRFAGPLLILGSALAFSSAGLFTRVLTTDVWTMIFWRSVFGGALIAGFILWRDRAAALGAFRSTGRPGLAAGACSTVGTICFVNALRLTTVADVTIIYATAPFIAAAAAWLWTRERPSAATLAASLLALCGVVVMFDAAVTAGHAAGNLLALPMTILIAAMMVIMRRHREVSMLPASCLSAFACALAVLPLARPADVAISELFLLALFGTQFGVGLLLLTLGSRLISAARASLLGNVELPVAPFWVWLAIGEMPAVAAMIGGGIVMLAILLDMAVAAVRERS